MAPPSRRSGRPVTLEEGKIGGNSFAAGSFGFASSAIIYIHVSLANTLNSVYNDYVYNDIPVIAIEFHGPGHDASI